MSRFNTTSSFVTNTNWQYYGGETTLTYFAQMAGLTVQNFISAGVGIVVVVALIRGIVEPQQPQPGELLPGHRADGPLHPRADRVRQRAHPRLPGLDPEHLALRLGARDQQASAQTIAMGPVAFAGGDQGARDQRRRLLQHELGASVREPERLHELLRDAARADHPGVAWSSCTARWSDRAARLHRDLRDDVRHVLRRGRRRLPAAEAHGSPACSTPPGSMNTQVSRGLDRRQHGGQGAALRDRRLGAV